MNLKTLMQERYVAKEFSNAKISEKDFQEIKEMITLAPSSFGLQPFKIKVITDQETKEKLLIASHNQKQVTTCSHLLVFCADDDVFGKIEDYKKILADHHVPEEKVEAIAQVLHKALKNKTQEERHLWASEQAHIALAHAMLGAKSLGIDSCPMGGFDAAAYKKVLQLPNHLTPVVVCPLGYGVDQPRPKKRFENLFF